MSHWAAELPSSVRGLYFNKADSMPLPQEFKFEYFSQLQDQNIETSHTVSAQLTFPNLIHILKRHGHGIIQLMDQLSGKIDEHSSGFVYNGVYDNNKHSKYTYPIYNIINELQTMNMIEPIGVSNDPNRIVLNGEVSGHALTPRMYAMPPYGNYLKPTNIVALVIQLNGDLTNDIIGLFGIMP